MSFGNDAKETGKFSLLIVLAFVVIFGGIGAFVLFGERFVKPFQEETRYQTQQNSQAYRDGLRQQINQMQLDLATADAGERNAILSVARQQFGSLDSSTLSSLQPQQKDFLREAGIYLD